jgi:hypothetical protein
VIAHQAPVGLPGIHGNMLAVVLESGAKVVSQLL